MKAEFGTYASRDVSWVLPDTQNLQFAVFMQFDCRGVGARALSNGINSAVFFCFFEALRTSFAKRKEQVGFVY